MDSERPQLLTFAETYFERIWGGKRLADSLGRPVPPGKVIGEAWLVADHEQCRSVVDAGPWAGKTLRELMVECPEYLLGTHVKPTPCGRFPLLLKLIDAGDMLSVQVHPDDAIALRLGEPDVGKTEMWHVLEADPGAELVCGLAPGTTRESFTAAVAEGRVEACMTRFPAPPDTSVFVPAGTVHAIGGGILLAEIQQNSNLTYRVHDWNRVDDRGQPRELHLDKAMESISFHSSHAGPSVPTPFTAEGQHRELLSICRHFVAERTLVSGPCLRQKGTGSFHLVVAVNDNITVFAGSADILAGSSVRVSLRRGATVLVPGSVPEYTLEGKGAVLTYYVPKTAQE